MGMIGELHAPAPAEVTQLLAAPELVGDVLAGCRRAGRSLSLEKAWHGLHFLLTGSAWEGEAPLNFLLLGGQPVGDDLGYGPVRLLGADEVRYLDGALARLPEDLLRSWLDPAKLDAEQIYPQIWDEPEEQLREEYGTYYRELKDFVRRAAADGRAILILIS